MGAAQKNFDKDIIILGGGLSGCLLFYFLKKRCPHFKIALVERNCLGGDHTWSLHASDIPEGLAADFHPLLSKSWEAYDVHFPEYSRHLCSGYSSIQSSEFSEKVKAVQAPDDLILEQTSARIIDPHTVETTARSWTAQWVVDCTGWQTLEGPLGYQKFVGLELEFSRSHGLLHPILKDARVSQTDGYRFMYALPFSDRKLLLEDTYYSNSPQINSTEIETQILLYAKKYFSPDFKIVRREEGCLPLCLTKQKEVDTKTLQMGAASLYYQPVTGYSLPQTLKMLELLMDGFSQNLSATEMIIRQKKFTQQREKSLSFLRMLNRMLFLAAKPEKRYVILQRFYKMPEALIHRFYRGDMTVMDQVRTLAGKPPVSITKALKAIFN